MKLQEYENIQRVFEQRAEEMRRVIGIQSTTNMNKEDKIQYKKLKEEFKANKIPSDKEELKDVISQEENRLGTAQLEGSQKVCWKSTYSYAFRMWTTTKV